MTGALCSACHQSPGVPSDGGPVLERRPGGRFGHRRVIRFNPRARARRSNVSSDTPRSIDGTGSPWGDFAGDEAGAFPNRDWLIQPATKDGAGLQRNMTGSYLLSGLTASSYRVEVVSARTTF